MLFSSVLLIHSLDVREVGYAILPWMAGRVAGLGVEEREEGFYYKEECSEEWVFVKQLVFSATVTLSHSVSLSFSFLFIRNDCKNSFFKIRSYF